MIDPKLRYGPSFVLLVFGASCAGQAMQVSPDLGKSSSRMGLEIMTAETYDEEGIQFGDYRVTNITHMPATKTVDKTTGKKHIRESYTYQVRHDGEKWFGECAARVDEHRPQANSIYELRCRLRPLGGDMMKSWYLDIAGGTAGGELSYGEVKRLGEMVAIRSIHGGETGDREKLGFELSTDEATVGAVQTDDNQALWIRGELDDDMKKVVAASAAGLVLFEHVQRL